MAIFHGGCLLRSVDANPPSWAELDFNLYLRSVRWSGNRLLELSQHSRGSVPHILLRFHLPKLPNPSWNLLEWDFKSGEISLPQNSFKIGLESTWRGFGSLQEWVRVWLHVFRLRSGNGCKGCTQSGLNHENVGWYVVIRSWPHRWPFKGSGRPPLWPLEAWAARYALGGQVCGHPLLWAASYLAFFWGNGDRRVGCPECRFSLLLQWLSDQLSY